MHSTFRCWHATQLLDRSFGASFNAYSGIFLQHADIELCFSVNTSIHRKFVISNFRANDGIRFRPISAIDFDQHFLRNHNLDCRHSSNLQTCVRGFEIAFGTGFDWYSARFPHKCVYICSPKHRECDKFSFWSRNWTVFGCSNWEIFLVPGHDA